MSLASTEIYNSRRKQASLSEDLAKLRKKAVSEEARRELSDAWGSLLSLLEQQLGPDELEGGFNKLGAALRNAGFWQPDGDANEASKVSEAAPQEPSADGGTDVPSPCSPEAPLARLRSETDIAESKNIRLEKKHKSDKSAKKEKKSQKDQERQLYRGKRSGIIRSVTTSYVLSRFFRVEEETIEFCSK